MKSAKFMLRIIRICHGYAAAAPSAAAAAQY